VVLVFSTTTWRSIAKVPPEPTKADPREKLQKMPKRGNMKKDIPTAAFFFGKKKTHRFSKNPVKTQAVVPIFDVYVFFSHQKVLTMIHFGGPAFFQKRATQHLNEKYMCKMMKNDTEK